MKKIQLLFLFISFSFFATAQQIASLDPSNAGPDDAATLIFDATAGNGELVGADKVYVHHGIITSSNTGTDWQYVIGNWGADDGIGEMTPVTGETDKWQLELSPTIRDYFGASSGESIFRLSLVFRSADGTVKGTMPAGNYGWGTVDSNLDIYLNLNPGNYITINEPLGSGDFFTAGQPLNISASASSEVTDMKIWLDDGNGFMEVQNVTSGTSINYSFVPSATSIYTIKVTGTINGQDLEVEKNYNVTILQPTVIEDLPSGLSKGINYNDTDPTQVTLVLEAPNKGFVFVVGDFTNWATDDNFQMKKTPNGELFWLEINGLTPQQEYVFQYWVDGEIRIGDPYADKVADPWNDQWIDAATYPNLPPYDKTEYSLATVLQTDQTPYTWAASEDTWERPEVNDMVIYELLVRDFLASHSWTELEDTLSYLKNLGVDAIELMPFNEFEGNESWGYNPSYYFAPDKYYGTKNQLKHFIQTAHQHGLAVIQDMVLNHAFGQNPMVRLYFDNNSNTPTSDNPWFNQNHVGPFEWGYDFNHESPYTQEFIDRVNKYWIEEYHVDGYRFDFTKGMTNYQPGGNIDGYDQSRIDILERMADQIWLADPEAYIILEHWGQSSEETQLGNYGMKMWRNKSYDYVPATAGNITGSFGGMNASSHVAFFDSHDERRIAEHLLTEGASNNGYDIKNKLVMYERVKMAAAFTFLYPGPKMMWQFDELGYDIDINFNGRVGNKPLPWGAGGLGYYEDPLRKYIYDAYAGILDVRKKIGADTLSFAQSNHKTSGNTRRISYNTVGTDLVVIGNFALNAEAVNPKFAQTGMWYNYFSGDSLDVTNVDAAITLQPGEWHIFTSKKLSDGLPGVVEVYDNPVTITPSPFTKNTEITIRFDATKAFPNGTAGLVGSDKVYIHSGVVLEHPDSSNLENIVGTLMDDGVGEMTEVSPDIWEITLTPNDYYNLASNDEPFKLGMYFRDADNVNLGMGFRDGIIFFDVDSDQPFISVEPAAYEIDDEITITFNAKKGNGELVGADKIYMHSSIDITDNTTPFNSAWGYVVGNWGADDGIGEMTELTNQPDIWEITLTPKDYYGLPNGSTAYWLAAVFRSADGSTKGTGTPGPIQNGFIHSNQDFFIENQINVSTKNLVGKNIELSISPNPTTSEQIQISLKGVKGNVEIELLDLMGKKLFGEKLNVFSEVEFSVDFDLGDVPKGMYLVRVVGEDLVVSEQIVKQ